MHLINYKYLKENDKIACIEELQLDIRTGEAYKAVNIHTLDGSKVEYAYEAKGKQAVLRLYNIPVYAVVDLIS